MSRPTGCGRWTGDDWIAAPLGRLWWSGVCGGSSRGRLRSVQGYYSLVLVRDCLLVQRRCVWPAGPSKRCRFDRSNGAGTRPERNHRRPHAVHLTPRPSTRTHASTCLAARCLPLSLTATTGPEPLAIRAASSRAQTHTLALTTRGPTQPHRSPPMAAPLKVCNLFGVAGKVCMCARRSTISSLPESVFPPCRRRLRRLSTCRAHARPIPQSTTHPSPHTDTDTD